MKFYKLILIFSASLNLIVQTSYAYSPMSPSMKYPIPNGFMHLFLNDLIYYVTSSNNSIDLATLDSKVTGTKKGANLLDSAQKCGKARYEDNTFASATVTDTYGNKTYNTVSAEDLTFNNKLISAKDLAQNLSSISTCASSTVENKPCSPSEAQCITAGANYKDGNCNIANLDQCTAIEGSWDSSSNICNCKSQSLAKGESFQKNKFINNNYNNRVWSNDVCLAIKSEKNCKNSPSALNGTDYGKLSWDNDAKNCKGPETACQLSLLGYLPLDTLVRNLPTQVTKTGDTKKAYQQFMQSLAQNPLVIRFVYSLISDINWVSQWSNSLLKSSIGESFSSKGDSAATHAAAQKNAKTILPYLINPTESKDSLSIEAQYNTKDIPLFSTPTSAEKYYSIINPYYLKNNPDSPNSVLPENFKFTNLTYPVNYVTITENGKPLPVPIKEESFNYCKYENALNQSNCIMLSQTGIPFGISQPNSGLKSLLLANISESNPKDPLWTDAYCMYTQSNDPKIYDSETCQSEMAQFNAYWGLLSGIFFLIPTFKELIMSAKEKYHESTEVGKAEKELRQAKDDLHSKTEELQASTAERQRLTNNKAEMESEHLSETKRFAEEVKELQTSDPTTFEATSKLRSDLQAEHLKDYEARIEKVNKEISEAKVKEEKLAGERVEFSGKVTEAGDTLKTKEKIDRMSLREKIELKFKPKAL